MALIFKEFLPYLVKHALEPTLCIVVYYYFSQEGRANQVMDFQAKIIFALYIAVANLSNVINVSVYDVIQQLFKFNLAMNRNHRIVQMLNNSLAQMLLLSFILSCFLMFFSPKIIETIIFKRSTDQDYQTFNSWIDIYRMASLKGML